MGQGPPHPNGLGCNGPLTRMQIQVSPPFPFRPGRQSRAAGGWRDVAEAPHLAEGIRVPKEQRAQKRISLAKKGAGRESGAQVIPSGSMVFIVSLNLG